MRTVQRRAPGRSILYPSSGPRVRDAPHGGLPLEVADRLIVEQGLGDRVEPVEQAMPLRLGDMESKLSLATIPARSVERQNLIAEVDRQLGPLFRLTGLGDRLPVGLGQLDD